MGIKLPGIGGRLFGSSFGGKLLGQGESDKKAALNREATGATAQAPASSPALQGTAIEHKASTLAGGLRDITREAVRTEESGLGLDRFYPDYLKKSG